MKKHIFGFMLFSFIFASFALTFAFFHASPNVSVKKTKQTEYPAERPVYCPKKQQGIDYRVLDSQFDLDSGEFVSNIHLNWTKSGKAPKKIFVNTQFFTLENGREKVSDETQMFTEPFGDFKATTITVRHKSVNELSVYINENLYVSFDFSQDEFSNDLGERSEDLSKINQVLFIHGEASRIKK